MTLFSQDDHLTAGAWAASATSDTFLHQTFKEALQGFFDRGRSRCVHSASFKSVNMQDKHGGSTRSHDYYLKILRDFSKAN